MSSMLVIDGSLGEGGGQILRSSLAMSLITGQPFRMTHIRAGRKKPGLLRQHLTAVRAAAAVGGASVEGDRLGSQELTFHPASVRGGELVFDVGSAGSATLVLQTVLPPLLVASTPSSLLLEGGTHNPFAPPFDYLERVFLPLIARMGARAEARLERAGFYPAGGGRMNVTVQPAPRLQRLELLERGAVRGQRARALLSRLPRQIGERELRRVRDQLAWPEEQLQVEEVASPGPGNALLLEVECEQITELFTAFGERGVPAEAVADRAVVEARRYLTAGIPVGEQLADQLLLPLALAGGGAFRTLPLSSHSLTNLDVLRRFVSLEVRSEERAPDDWLVELCRR
jgi:RNA 3'-terminal phosphate cyclase (ATP)